MKKLNPIIEALDGVDENTALAAAPSGKRKMKKPLKITIIAVAATLLLGTTAAAATLGEHPLVKLNDSQVTPKFSSYVNDNGWTIETTVVEYPVDTAGYVPVGEIRAVYDANCADMTDNIHYFDELGVRIDRISNQLAIYLKAVKEGEIDVHSMKGTYFGGDFHQSESMDQDGTISIEFWQDPIQMAQQASEEKRYAKMSVDEKIQYQLMYGWDIGYPEYGGFEHPSMRDILSADAHGSYGGDDVINFNGLPSDVAAKYYGYTLDKPDGFTEKDGAQVIMYFNDVMGVNQYGYNQMVKAEEPKVIQQMFIYTMTDNASGKDVKFTVWRSSEEKDVDTSCFKFDYEYIPLNNGTEARIHQSGYNYIVEFEKDGAAYAAVLDLDMELVERVLTNMSLL